MQQFRNLLKGWFGKVLLTIFILPFAFFGIEGIFQAGGRSDVAVSVNGVDISKVEVDRAINSQREAMVQQLGRNIDSGFLTDDMLRPRVMENLIQRELLRQAVAQEGLHVANAAIKSYVRSMPQFQDDTTGAFSQEKLESVLARAGYTPLSFYSELSNGMIVEQLQQGIGMSAFATEAELKTLVKLDRQTRDLSYATVKLDDFKKGIELTDDEVNAFYDENKSQYRTEEKVQIQYLSFRSSDFAKDTLVTDEDITQEYADYVKNQEGQERRRASHILVEVNNERNDDAAMARINEAKSKLEAGEDFASVAKTYSDDSASAINGGDLDYAGHGTYDTAFENALFSLKKEGALSDVVKTEFGYHIIKLTGIETPTVASLDAKRDELKQKLLDSRASERLAEEIDQMNELTYAAGDLGAVSEKYHKPVQESAPFGRRGGQGIAADPAIIEAAFSDNLLKEGMNSSAIELADGGVAVIRVARHEPARDRELTEVREQIIAALSMQKARDKTMTAARDVIAAVEAGEPLDSVEKKFHVTWTSQSAVTRQTSDLSRPVIAKLFEMPSPVEGARVVDSVGLPSGDQEVIVLTRVVDGAFDLSEDETRQALAMSSDRMGQLDFENYLATLRAQAKIVQ